MCFSGGMHTKVLIFLHDTLWGAPGVILLLGTGIWLTVHTGLPQIRFPRFALKALRTPGNAQVTSFQAFCTALAATVGTGNIVGVTGAICLGGPGAIFWMWICGCIGMATKFAEVTLASHYRMTCPGEIIGGTMYVIRQALPSKYAFLATLYCIFGVAAAFGVGNATQVNAVVSGVSQLLGRESPAGNLILGCLLAAIVGFVLFGGPRRIGQAAEKLVPLASLGYIGLCILVLVRCHSAIPEAWRSIFIGAFSPRAVTGGAVGSLSRCLGIGCARGVFTNEAGMGTAAMAYAGADGNSVEKGALGILEVAIDTLVICTMTALAVLCSGIPLPYGQDQGAMLANQVFTTVCGRWAGGALTIFIAIFAFATVLGWGLYGARCGQYLLGEKFWNRFVLLQMAGVILGAVMRSQTLWLMAETVNALMAIPNLIALILLTPKLKALTAEYLGKDSRFLRE